MAKKKILISWDCEICDLGYISKREAEKYESLGIIGPKLKEGFLLNYFYGESYKRGVFWPSIILQNKRGGHFNEVLLKNYTANYPYSNKVLKKDLFENETLRTEELIGNLLRKERKTHKNYHYLTDKEFEKFSRLVQGKVKVANELREELKKLGIEKLFYKPEDLIIE